MFFLTRVRGVPKLYPTRAIVVKLREVLDAIRKQGSWRPMSRGKFCLRSDFFVACCLKAKAFANSKAGLAISELSRAVKTFPRKDSRCFDNSAYSDGSRPSRSGSEGLPGENPRLFLCWALAIQRFERLRRAWRPLRPGGSGPRSRSRLHPRGRAGDWRLGQRQKPQLWPEGSPLDRELAGSAWYC